MRLDRRISLALGLGILLTLPAFAQQATPETTSEDSETKITIKDEVVVEGESPYFPGEVASTTKTATPMHLLPQSATSVPATLIAEQNARVLTDTLAYTPGMNVQSQFGIHDFFVLRGFDSLSSSLILTDGTLEPEATFYRTYNLDRVEVLRGPAGFLYGGNAIGGLVNLVRKRPATEASTEVALSAGSDANVYATFDLDRRLGDVGLRVNGMWQQGDGYRDGKDFDVFAINPTISWRSGEKTTFGLSAEYVSSDFTPDSGLPILSRFSLTDFSLTQEIPDVPRERSYDTPFDFSDQEIVRLRFDVEHEMDSGLVLRNKTYLTTLDWQSRGTLPLAAFEDPFVGAAPIFRLRNTLDDEQQVLGNQFDAVFSAQTGSVKHDLVVGLELQQLDDDFAIGTGQLPTIDVFNPVETATGQDFLFLTQGADVTTRVIAPYVHDTLHLGDRWRLSLGARFDSIDISGDQSQASFDPTTGQPFVFGGDIDDRESQLSPFAGLLFAPSEQLSLYANFSQSFSPQSTRALAAVVVPEEGEQFEVGAKARLFGGKAQAALAYFDLQKDNIAILNNDGVTAQLGDQSSRGVELELSGGGRRGLHWLFNYAWTDAELTRFVELVPASAGGVATFVDRSGNTPAFAPEQLASFWVHQRFENGFGVGGGARYTSEQFIDEDNAFEIDSYVLFDATLSYTFGTWEANLWLKNLGDEEYEVRGFSPTSVIPADGFNVAVGLRYKL